MYLVRFTKPGGPREKFSLGVSSSVLSWSLLLVEIAEVCSSSFLRRSGNPPHIQHLPNIVGPGPPTLPSWHLREANLRTRRPAFASSSLKRLAKNGKTDLKQKPRQQRRTRMEVFYLQMKDGTPLNLKAAFWALT